MSLISSVSGRAEADLTRQYEWYVEKDSMDLAERFLEAFDQTISRLVQNPTLGRRRRFRSLELQGIRSLAISRPFSSHLVFYRVDEECVSIERVMHGGRDLARRLLEP